MFTTVGERDNLSLKLKQGLDECCAEVVTEKFHVFLIFDAVAVFV